MRFRALFAAVLIATWTASFAQPAPAGQVSDVGSAVSLRVADGRLSGKVTTGEPDCRAHRTVVVTVLRKGRDGTLAKTGTDADGRWSVKAGSLKDRTRIRAEVRNGFTPEFTCLKATSPARVYRQPKKR